MIVEGGDFVRGGMKVYRGSPTAARNYVEADRARADDYYLAEGTGLAEHYFVTSSADGEALRLRRGQALDGETYESWVAGRDTTGAPKGRLRTDEQAVRFVEVVVNGPKTWSLAAALHPEIARAYDDAQQRAAEEIICWLAEHSTTRVGPRGRQVQVCVEKLESAVIRHYTSRAGDPHRHLHLQINARVWAMGRWRGIHTVGVRDNLAAINGMGRAAMQCHAGFRHALAAHGYTLDTESGEISQLAGYTREFSARAAQIARHIDRFETEWRAAHPDQEPGPRLRRSWDTRAWAEGRPDKVVPANGADLARGWIEELYRIGYRPPTSAVEVGTPSVGDLNRDSVVATVLDRLGAHRSGWNAADIRGEVEQIIAAAGIVADGAVRRELAEDLTSRALAGCVPLLSREDVPEHVRAWTSPRVLAVEEDLTRRLAARGGPRGADQQESAGSIPAALDPTQRAVVTALVHGGALTVVEGAAGAGKTTILAEASTLLAAQHHRLVVVTPTLKAAEVAAQQVADAAAASAAWLVHQHGFRWDQDGRWTRVTGPHATQPADDRARLLPGDVLLVDEAGMLDQDVARALAIIADESHARLALVGDRHQLPAVGRGGVLDLAARWAPSGACLTLDAVRRFTDPEYAELTLLMRTGERSEEVFDRLLVRGEIRVHRSDLERADVLARAHATSSSAIGREASLLIADTQEQVAQLNDTIRDHRMSAGRVANVNTTIITTASGARIGVGDRVATRRNDRDLRVANRDTWTVTGLDANGVATVAGRKGERTLPASYAREHLELAYATTVYGAQGDTVGTADFLVGEQTGAAAAYVAMTRGRHHNTAHLVAESVDDARTQWVTVFARDRADLGPQHVASLAADDIDRYGATAPDNTTLQAAALRMHRATVGRPRVTEPASTHGSRPERGIGR
jgi:conjugative relaxase-like TrwC/TraI family protein